jgi:hypothetical protein
MRIGRDLPEAALLTFSDMESYDSDGWEPDEFPEEGLPAKERDLLFLRGVRCLESIAQSLEVLTWDDRTTMNDNLEAHEYRMLERLERRAEAEKKAQKTPPEKQGD